MSTVSAQLKFNDFRKLTKCVADLIRCKSYLESSAADSMAALENLARKMEVSSIVQQRHTIAIAGMQGTGKSTLIKNLYGLPENLLRVNSSRGEQVPVFITEKADLTAGTYAARRVYFDDDLCKFEEEIPIKEVAKWSRGHDHTAYVELFVPSRYFHTDRASFVLLPGFEKNRERSFNQDYNSLMEYTLHFANAVVLVTNDDGLANADILVLLDMLGKNFSPHNCIFAITSCDGISEQNCSEMVETLLTSCDECGLTIHKRQIVCTGEYRTKEENQRWHSEIVDAIENYLDYNSAKKTYDYFLPMIEEIETHATRLRTVLDAKALTAGEQAPHYALLKEALEQSEKELEQFMDTACTKAKQEVAERFQTAYGNIPGKYKTSKRMLFFNKKYETIAADRNYVREQALETLRNPSSDSSELIHQVQAALPASSFHKNAESHPLLLTGREENTAMSIEEQQKQVMLCNQVVRGYLDSNVPRIESVKCGDLRAVQIVTNEFNTYFLSMLVGNIDPKAVPLRTGGLQKSVDALQKKGSRKIDLASTIALVDLLDGKSDIMQTVTNLFVKDAEKAAVVASAAAGWAVVAVAAVAVAKKGLDLYNQVVDNQNAIGETWEYALMNAVEEQRNNILDSYREAADKMLEHVQRVHEERMGVDAERSRIMDAKYALANIAAISNSFHDQYADILEKRAQQ